MIIFKWKQIKFLGGIYGGVSAVANGQNVLSGILIGALVGGLTGLITEVATIPWMLLGTFAIGVGGDILSQLVLDNKSLIDVNLNSAFWAGVGNAVLALGGKNLSLMDKAANLGLIDSAIFGTITNSPLLALGMTINMIISKSAQTYPVYDVYSRYINK